jgi:hypothetical protein
MVADEPEGGPVVPSDEGGLEPLLPEDATPEDVMRLVREMEAISAGLEALLQARMGRRRRP